MFYSYLLYKLICKKMLRNIVENIVDRRLLTEISVRDAYDRFYTKVMSPEDYQNTIKIIQPDNNILLPETKWVLQCLQRDMNGNSGRLAVLRNQKGTGYLDLWERLKIKKMIQGQDANINRFKSIAELQHFINEFDINDILRRTSGEWSKAVNDAKNDIRKVYEDEMWFVIVPLSTEASCYWGNGTHWCTATRDEGENMFHNYFDDEDIFILINKQNKEKYQFHFSSDQFMDKTDTPIESPIFRTIGATNGLISYFQEYCENEGYMDEFIDMIYDIIGMEQHGLTPIKLGENDYNLIDENNQIAFPNMVFTTPTQFNYEWAPVNFIKDEEVHHNIMNYEGEFLFSTLNISELGTPSGRYVYLRAEEYGVNYVNLEEGKLVSNEWFADGNDFSNNYKKNNSYAIVEDENGERNVLRGIDGKLAFSEWFDNVRYLEGLQQPYFIISKDNKNGRPIFNIMNFEGEYCLPKWYDLISDAGAITGEVMVCKSEGKYDLIDISDKRIIGTDFNVVYKLTNVGHIAYPFFHVGKMGKHNLLTLNHGYLLPEWADNIKYKHAFDKDYLLITIYDGKEFVPVQEDFRDNVVLKPFTVNKTNENKIKENDLIYIIKETINKLK